MASELQPLNYIFQGTKVRWFLIADMPWCALADICRILEINNPSQAAARLDDDERNTLINSEGIQGPGNPNLTLISEAGLYKILQTSRKPFAREFDRWIRHTVLPSIRKTGSYSVTNPDRSPFYIIKEIANEAVLPLVHEVGELRREVKGAAGNVIQLLNAKSRDRKDASPETVREHHIVDWYHYKGKCPCLDPDCNRIIADADGFIPGTWAHHHQFNRWDNRPSAMIPLAKECHEKIERDPEARTKFGLQAFPQFQNLLSRLPKKAPRFPFPDGL